MIQTIAVQHLTYETERPFDDVARDFSKLVGTLEHVGWDEVHAASGDPTDLERRVRQYLGPSGFTRFLTINHGEWLTRQGRPSRFIQYTIGNPMIAITMTKHDVEAGLDLPVRIAIYEHPNGKTRLVYNTPSSLMSGLNSEAVHAAALKLDVKMTALAEAVTGVRA